MEAEQSWRLKHLKVGSTVHGGSGQAIVILERCLLNWIY